MLSHFSHVQLCATPWTTAHQAPLSTASPDKNTGVGCHFHLHHPLYKVILRILVRIPSFNSVSYQRGILFIVQGVVEVGLRIVFSSCLSPDLIRTGGISFLFSSFLLNISHTWPGQTWGSVSDSLSLFSSPPYIPLSDRWRFSFASLY